MKNNKDKLKPISVLAVVVIVVWILVSITSQMYFSPARINGYIAKSVKDNTEIKLDFKKAQLSFSGSLRPFFAIKISKPKVYVANCKGEYRFTAPYVLVPFSMTKALDQKMKFGYLKAGAADVIIKKSLLICPDSQQENSETNEILASLTQESFVFEEFFSKIKSAFKSLDGLRFQKLNITDLRDENKEKTIRVDNLRLSYRDKTKSVYSYFEIDFQPNDFNVPGTASEKNIKLKVKIDLTLSQGLSLQISARHLEGLLAITSEPQKNINQYIIQAKIKDLPLSFLNYMTGLEALNAINSHRVWFNSNLKLTFENILNSKKRKVGSKFSNLEVYGPVLKAYASNFEAELYPNYSISNNLNWRLDYLNFNGLLSQKNLAKARGVINQFGEIRGSGKVQTDGKLSFEGILKESSFAFSMNRKKTNQILSKANISLSLAYPILNLAIENINLEQGLFDGDVKGELDWKQDLVWNFNIKAETFRLSDNVLKLFALEQTAFNDVQIKISGQKRQLESLSAVSNIESLKTKWGEFRTSKYLLNYRPDSKTFKFDLSSKFFDPNTNYFKIELLDNYKSLRNFTTSLILPIDGKSFEMTSKNNGSPAIEVRAEGEDYNKDFMAFMKLDQTNLVLEGSINSKFKVKSVE
jgi:hypothetical protein